MKTHAHVCTQQLLQGFPTWLSQQRVEMRNFLRACLRQIWVRRSVATMTKCSNSANFVLLKTRHFALVCAITASRSTCAGLAEAEASAPMEKSSMYALPEPLTFVSTITTTLIPRIVLQNLRGGGHGWRWSITDDQTSDETVPARAPEVPLIRFLGH